MIKPDLLRTLCAAPLLLAVGLTMAGCTTPAAKDFRGSWKPVNNFQDETTEIPLAQSYRFFASPMDGTLKTMLTRWAKDTSMTLSYQLTSDFTLYKPVSRIQTNDVRAAAAELSTIYSDEGVAVTINDKQILVAVADVSKPDASENKPAPDVAKKKIFEAPTGPAPSASSVPLNPSATLPAPVMRTAASASSTVDSVTASSTSATTAAPAANKP